ncbi:MAG TPA: 4,5-DOPA dioxygenase extradiol [Ginsengibacter sp.]|nr:4,5-DOPA dioxygenase extradiol [Ginsengibacter sp.]HRP16647.1 4,5-DOPA dioxygenase extradiol [Ginsengibacter sp.]HRP43746.1 4,5-DOPA dioxygenase extradiol [Ginsengibacter sp.]
MADVLRTGELGKIIGPLKSTEKMPVLFVGHGNPMNAIAENEFVQGFRKVSGEIPKPNAIICVSAHWETAGTYITAMERPKTIHDFGGFPRELYEVQYPAPGSPELAKATKELITSAEVGLDHDWGLDHGAWSVIKHFYPEAEIPVVELSLDYYQTPQYHYELAKELRSLRDKGVLIIGSGNMVHNLRKVAWDKLNENYGYDWALEASEKMKEFILDGNDQSLINFSKQGKVFELAVPTPEHYLPLLYAIALRDKNEAIELFNDKALGGSLTMTSLKIGG